MGRIDLDGPVGPATLDSLASDSIAVAADHAPDVTAELSADHAPDVTAELSADHAPDLAAMATRAATAAPSAHGP